MLYYKMLWRSQGLEMDEVFAFKTLLVRQVVSQDVRIAVPQGCEMGLGLLLKGNVPGQADVCVVAVFSREPDGLHEAPPTTNG